MDSLQQPCANETPEPRKDCEDSGVVISQESDESDPTIEDQTTEDSW